MFSCSFSESVVRINIVSQHIFKKDNLSNTVQPNQFFIGIPSWPQLNNDLNFFAYFTFFQTRYLWLRWANNDIEAGRGSIAGQGRIMHWEDQAQKPYAINSLSISTLGTYSGVWQFARTRGTVL